VLSLHQYETQKDETRCFTDAEGRSGACDRLDVAQNEKRN
jgi:hypothetical protein